MLSKIEYSASVFSANVILSNPPAQLFLHRFAEVVRNQPNALAVSADVCLNYQQLDELSNNLAAKLVQRAIQPGDVVGVIGARRSTMISGILGILKAGAIYLPLDLNLPERRRQLMLEESSAKLVLDAGTGPETTSLNALSIEALCDTKP